MGLILGPHKEINTGEYKFDLYSSHVYAWCKILILVPCITHGIIYYVMAGRWIRDLSNPRSKVEEVIARGRSPRAITPETESWINPVSTDQAMT